MKMRPTVNSDESVSTDRSAHVARYTDRSSRRPKEQISASKNVQTEYKTHLSQNAAYSSTYGPSTMPDQHVAHRVNKSQVKEGQRDVRNSEKTEQKHRGIDTRDLDSRSSCCKFRSKFCVNLRLCCLRFCRAKKRCSDRVLRKPTRRVLERIKARSKKCGKPDDTVAIAGVSTDTPVTVPHRDDPISHRDEIPKKSRRSHKQDETVKVVDKDKIVDKVSLEDTQEERKERRRREKDKIVDKVSLEDTQEERKERRRREKEERRRKAMMAEEDEARERRERREHEERIPHLVDARPVARDEELVAEDRVLPARPPPSIADPTKTCCYLCAQTTLAIAAVSRPEQSDKCVQVSAHKFLAETSPALDKSCSPLLLVRTVQSSVKVRTRETLYPDAGAGAVLRGRETGPLPPYAAKKRKKFAVFPGLTRTKCPAGRHAACGTDKSTDKSTATRDDNAEKRERCCGERNARPRIFPGTHPD